MPVGVIVNCLSVLIGGFVGAALTRTLSDKLKSDLSILFGFCSIAIGINSIIKAQAMTAVVLAILGGFIIGHILNLDTAAIHFFRWLVETLRLGRENIDMDMYITVVALFCCSGFGWDSTLIEGIAGDTSLLFSKSVLDFFTALVFAAALGRAVCVIAGPQILVLLVIFGVGRMAGAWITLGMFADLSACGGILTLAAGMRVAKIKSVPLVNLIPSLILVMPLSALWTTLMG